MNREQVLAFRLARHHLDARRPAKDLVRVVRRLVGIQSQVSSAAALSIAARVDLEPAEVEAAVLERRVLARTWGMRCTLHLVAREDVPLVAAALGVEVGGFKRWLERCGLTEKRYEQLRDVVLDALRAGPLSRAELESAAAAHLAGTTNLFGSWGGIMKLLALEGLIVLGPRRGTETTFVRADAWWGAPSKLPDRAAASSELLRRYLAVYGPATLRDFTYWAGLPAGRAREALSTLRVARLDLDGREHLLLPEDLDALGAALPSTTVRLLPTFDTYLLGHRDKSLLYDARHAKKIFRAAGWVSATVLRGGRVVATWTLERGRVAVSPLERLSRETWSAIREEAARLGVPVKRA